MRKHRQNWLDIFSGFRVALDARKIVLGTLGQYMTILVFLGLLANADRWWPGVQGVGDRLSQAPLRTMGAVLCGLPATICTACCEAGSPATSCVGFQKLAFLAGGGIVLLFIWAFFGGAISRIAAVDFARDERPQLSEAISFTAGKFGSFFWAPLVPLIFAAIFGLCNALLGVIGRIPAAGPVIMGLFFVLAMVSGFLIVLLLIGTVLGCAFMWPTVAMEGTDAFDAISRSFNYLYARPWKTLWCWLCAGAYGVVVIGFVGAFAGLMIKIALGTVALGMGGKFVMVRHFIGGGIVVPQATVPDRIAMILMEVVIVAVVGLVLGFIASYKFSAMTIIYAVLRRDVDGTDMNEVYLPEVEETPAEPPADAGKPAEPKPAE